MRDVVTGVLRGPLRRLPTTARLWAAVLLCIAPMGLVWATRYTPGTTLYGDCGYTDSTYCVPDQYLPGRVDSQLVSQSPVRLFLVFAALAFAFCALRARTDRTRTLARAAVAALVIAAAFAAAAGASQVLICVLAALVTVVPAVTGATAGSTRFGARPPSRVK